MTTPVAPTKYASLIDEKSTEYEEVKGRFMKDWVKKEEANNIRVDHILRVHPSKKCSFAFSTYTRRMVQNGKSARLQLYHGTIATCDLINNLMVCTMSTCPMCNIVRGAFDPMYIGINHRNQVMQRFGWGFYLAPDSSKSHFYAGPGERVINGGFRAQRAMLLCEVELGSWRLATKADEERDQTTTREFDCLFGKANTAGLNYSEYCFLRSEAILPSCIIIYSYDLGMRGKVLHYESYNDSSVMLRLVLISLVGLVATTAVSLFLVHSSTSYNYIVGQNASELLYHHFPSLVGILLLLWCAAWCLGCWSWKVTFGALEPPAILPNTLSPGPAPVKPTGLICFLPTGRGWKPMVAISRASGESTPSGSPSLTSLTCPS
ncbi:hypothetical protein BJ684DRAFT_18222 [Piptocephalis cylindrospora]|uniref:PARP catalytic domain-containing protein n=1 Tax=Piptocephalis cylindrospora TaxID=1907219 RepID=A0A4P9Y8F2_9FUNG|nr:hypothetical protein BJ684DRAFT_18222 [Piptocephalis cylindrospora]|eukprot:RKP15446.1 hypothetical protein BJ684DRAFT_18222 [Piptocephalis cylindrospora]